MNDLRELYQEVILDHGRRPRNFEVLEHAQCSADGCNPLCGDHCRIYVNLDGDILKEIRFHGNGCAISTASASLMTQHLQGKSKAEALEIFECFHEMIAGSGTTETCTPRLGKLMVLEGVRAYPTRVKCATLAWHTLKAALERPDSEVSTE